MSSPDIRSMLLEIIAEKDAYIQGDRTRGSLQQGSVLQEVQQRLGRSQPFEMQQAILTCWYDLFRTGILAWGYDLCNTDQPFCHVTIHGKLILENLSRDPSNPSGYLSYLSKVALIEPITHSYLQEALNTYNSNCVKASAVMVGAAAESLVLTIQSLLIGKMDKLGLSKPRDLEDWRIKKILQAIENIVKERKKNMPVSLFDSFEAYWPAFTHQIRTVRNESGHPTSIEPVTRDTVHAVLLVFPELASLANKLRAWIDNDMNE